MVELRLNAWLKRDCRGEVGGRQAAAGLCGSSLALAGAMSSRTRTTAYTCTSRKSSRSPECSRCMAWCSSCSSYHWGHSTTFEIFKMVVILLEIWVLEGTLAVCRGGASGTSDLIVSGPQLLNIGNLYDWRGAP